MLIVSDSEQAPHSTPFLFIYFMLYTPAIYVWGDKSTFIFLFMYAPVYQGGKEVLNLLQ